MNIENSIDCLIQAPRPNGGVCPKGGRKRSVHSIFSLASVGLALFLISAGPAHACKPKPKATGDLSVASAGNCPSGGGGGGSSGGGSSGGGSSGGGSGGGRPDGTPGDPHQLDGVTVTGSRGGGSSSFINFPSNSGNYRSGEGGGGGGGGTERAKPDDGTDTESCPTDHPVVPESGNKILPQSDFSTEGDNALYLDRTYSKAYTRTNPIFGNRWSSSIDYSLQFNYSSGPSCTYYAGAVIPACSQTGITSIYAWRPNGERFTYTWNAAAQKYLTSSAKPRPYIYRNGAFWDLIREDNALERYSDIGAPYDITDEYGVAWYFNYNGAFLKDVSHSSGRKMQFFFSGNKVSSVIDPAGNTYSYSYNSNGYLSSVTRPVSSASSEIVTYHYENASLPDALTGVSYNGQRYSKAAYFADGKVSSSGLDGGQETLSFVYTTNTTAITNAKGAKTTLTYTNLAGVGKRLSNRTRIGVTNCPSSATSFTYDTNGFVKTSTDALSRVSNYSYDADGLLLSLERGNGAYKEVNVWDPALKKISNTKIYLNNVIDSETIYEYYPSGDPAARRPKSISVYNRSQNGQANQLSKRSYSYLFWSNKLLQKMTVDGPLPGTGDSTTYDFDSLGNLLSIKNALNQTVLQQGSFDGSGRAQSVVDLTGLATQVTYDRRGRVSKLVRSGLTTDYTYTPLGDVSSRKASISTDSITANYQYTPIGRMSSVSDSDGNSSQYTYDVLGNVTNMTSTRGGDSFSSSYEFDEAGRLVGSRNGNTEAMVYAYNTGDELISTTDALNRTTRYDYDAMGRLKTTTFPDNKSTISDKDGLGRVTSVKDPNGRVTTYRYDGFGSLVYTSSPDTGITTAILREDGAKTSVTYGDGGTDTLGYDNLGRLTSRRRATLLTENFVYDSCTYGRGRLCSVADASGSTAFTYNQNGQTATQKSTIKGLLYSTAWNYDALGRLTKLTYPSGNIVSYAYDGGDINSVSVTPGIATGQTADPTSLPVQNFAGAFAMGPGGVIRSMTLGNGQVRTVLRYPTGKLRRISVDDGSLVSGAFAQNINYVYDAAGQLESISNTVNSAAAQQLDYDSRGRLTDMSADVGNQRWFYDANSNWTSHSYEELASLLPQNRTDYLNISPSSNRVASVDVGNSLLSAISGSPRWNYSYDGRGNVISTSVASADAQTELKPNSSYKYDAFNRMTQVSRKKNGVEVKTNYAYNALNQRVRKDGVSGITHFNFDMGGRLLSETKAVDLGDTLLNNVSVGTQDPSSLVSTSNLSLPTVPSTVGVPTDYIWLGGEIVGMIRGLSVYYIHNDHLGRPEVVSNNQNAEVWRADNLPYNRTVTKDVFGGLNIGFPGQYYDAESELYYNWHRYYDPNTGRYTQADPIGLGGGSNPYSYVGGNPVSFVDPWGLAGCNPSFIDQVNKQFLDTNKATPGILALPGLGLATGGATAQAMGLPSMMGAAAESFAARTISGSFYFAGYAAVANFVLVSTAFEGGMYVGSALYVGAQNLMQGTSNQGKQGGSSGSCDCQSGGGS